MLSEKTISRVDLIPYSMLAFLGLAFGLILIGSGLEGAGMLPHLMLRSGIHYTAYQAVVEILMGQVSLGCSIGAAYLFRKEWKRAF